MSIVDYIWTLLALSDADPSSVATHFCDPFSVLYAWEMSISIGHPGSNHGPGVTKCANIWANISQELNGR